MATSRASLLMPELPWRLHSTAAFLLWPTGPPRHVHWEVASCGRTMQQGMASAAISVFHFEADQGTKQHWSSETVPGQGVGSGDRGL